MISKAERRRFIDERINSDWGWVDYRKPAPHENPAAYSIQDMWNALARQYGRENIPSSRMTIQRDVEALREAFDQSRHQGENEDEAARLLEPEHFDEFRQKLRGPHYETPPHQYHLYRVLRSLALKEPVPQDTIDWFDEMDPVHPFPENLNDLIVEQQKMLSFLFLVAPRHGKTDLVQDFTLQMHAGYPNTKILYGNGTIKKTMSFIGNYFMPILEHHEWLNATYGPFKDDSKAWSKEGYILAKREGFHKSESMHPFGIDGDVLSLDSDLILADDISNLRRARSEATTDNDFDWITTNLMTRREPGTAFAYVGSHVATDTGDLFERLEQKADDLNTGDHMLIIKKIPAHRYDKCKPDDPDHERCVLWPTLRPYSFLEGMRGLMADDAMFEAVYNQVPRQRRMMHFPGDLMRKPYVYPEIPDGQRVRPVPDKSVEVGVLDATRSWREADIACCGKDAVVTMGFDPAFSESKGAAFTAVAVQAGCVRCGRRYIIDWDEDRMSSAEHLPHIERFLRAYPQISMLTMEDNVAQKYLTQDPRTDDMLRQYRVTLKEWTTDERKHDSDMGIPNYSRHARSGMLSIPYKTLFDQEYAERLIKEFIRWPNRPNDAIMALWLSDLAIQEIVEDLRYTQAATLPGGDKWRTDFHDEMTFEVDLDMIDSDGWEYHG